MTETTRHTLSRTLTVIAWVVLFTSGMLLCACPGWPAIGLGSAVAAAWLRRGRNTLWTAMAVVFGLLATGAHTWEKLEMPGSRASRIRAVMDAHRERAKAGQAPMPTTNLSLPSPPLTNRNR